MFRQLAMVALTALPAGDDRRIAEAGAAGCLPLEPAPVLPPREVAKPPGDLPPGAQGGLAGLGACPGRFRGAGGGRRRNCLDGKWE